MKRLITLLVCFCLFSSIGCSVNKTASQPVINVWHWMTDRDAAFQELAKRYEAKTGIKVNFELYAPSDAYSQKVRAAAQGSTLPDIFGVLGEKRVFASFIKGGFILDLSPFMNRSGAVWKNRFFSKALLMNEFPEGNSYGVPAGIYGVPIDVMTIQMVYNRDLLRQLGYDKPPQNFVEFLEIGRKAHENKLQGMVSGWSELWMIDCLANNYAFNIMGQDKVLATIKGEVKYTDPDWIRVFSLFREMKEAGMLADVVVTMVNKTAEQLFASNKSVFAFNGSWCVNVYQGMNPKLDYSVFLPPKASDKFPMMVWGGAGSSFLVNQKSKNKEESVKFLEWLTDKEQQSYLGQTTKNLPSNKDSVESLSPVLVEFAKNLEQNSTHPNIWGMTEFPLVIEAMDKGIQSIIIGEKEPEQVAKEVQEIKERELRKRGKI